MSRKRVVVLARAGVARDRTEAAIVQAVKRRIAANSFVRIRLSHRMPVPGWGNVWEGAAIDMRTVTHFSTLHCTTMQRLGS